MNLEFRWVLLFLAVGEILGFAIALLPKEPVTPQKRRKQVLILVGIWLIAYGWFAVGLH